MITSNSHALHELSVSIPVDFEHFLLEIIHCTPELRFSGSVGSTTALSSE